MKVIFCNQLIISEYDITNKNKCLDKIIITILLATV